MSRTHAIVIAVLLAVNAVVGTMALTRTLHLGQTAHTASSALVAKRTAQLDRFQASLTAQLAKKPPPLPIKPSAATQGSPAAAAGAPKVRYVRPAPIVLHTHRRGGEYEDDHEGGADD